jgi:hypothetical protein
VDISLSVSEIAAMKGGKRQPPNARVREFYDGGLGVVIHICDGLNARVEAKVSKPR